MAQNRIDFIVETGQQIFHSGFCRIGYVISGLFRNGSDTVFCQSFFITLHSGVGSTLAFLTINDDNLSVFADVFTDILPAGLSCFHVAGSDKGSLSFKINILIDEENRDLSGSRRQGA